MIGKDQINPSVAEITPRFCPSYITHINRDCSESTGLPPEDVYRKVRVRTIEPGGQHDVRSR